MKKIESAVNILSQRNFQRISYNEYIGKLDEELKYKEREK